MRLWGGGENTRTPSHFSYWGIAALPRPYFLRLWVYSDVVIKKYIVCYLPRIVDDQFLIPIVSRPRSMLHQYPNVGGAETYSSHPIFDTGRAEMYTKVVPLFGIFVAHAQVKVRLGISKHGHRRN